MDNASYMPCILKGILYIEEESITLKNMKTTDLSTLVEKGSFDSIASRLKGPQCLGTQIEERVPFPKWEGPLSAKYLPFWRDGEVVDGLNFTKPEYNFFHTPKETPLTDLKWILMLSSWECIKNNGSHLELTLCSDLNKLDDSITALATISYVSLTEIGIDRQICFHPFNICENFGKRIVENDRLDLLSVVPDRIRGWIIETTSIIEMA